MVRYDFYDNAIEYGRRIVAKDGKFGFVDKGGNEVVPPIYDDAQGFFYGNSMVVSRKKVWTYRHRW